MKLARVIILSLIIAGLIFFIPPENWLIIFIFIGLISLLISFFIHLFLSKKYAICAFLITFILMTLLALDLFDIINLILAISLVLGVFLLI